MQWKQTQVRRENLISRVDTLYQLKYSVFYKSMRHAQKQEGMPHTHTGEKKRQSVETVPEEGLTMFGLTTKILS